MTITPPLFTRPMQQIPESALRACLAVLYCACMHARFIAYQGQVEALPAARSRLLADLMDAVHNLPDLVTRWPECDETLLRGMLEDFDAKWSSEAIKLVETYDQALKT